MKQGPKLFATLLALLCADSAAAQVTNNDSSCDIGVTPAATLLLPYFEVDVFAPPAQAQTTLFTVVNTSALPQIARATIWTDWAFPVLTLDLFLTGYDVASVNLYDVLASGRIATAGTAKAGPLSAPNFANPNHAPTAVFDCNSRPAAIPPAMLNDVLFALATGRAPSGETGNCGTQRFGQIATNRGVAAGYVTIDVVATCSGTMPTDPRYFTSELLYDNVLTGDWMAVTPATRGNFATASPLVHIRAIPEGGRAATVVPAQLPYTFYGRLLTDRLPSERGADRRQPLPSVFAARFVQGLTIDFQTRLTIWREAVTGPNTPCSAYRRNSNLPISEVVRFDEHENATVLTPAPYLDPPLPGELGLPVTGSTHSASSIFPRLVSPHNDIAGWLYLNLGRYSASYQRTMEGAGQEQAWVTTSMFAEGRYSVAFDAAALQNGCTPTPPSGVRIGPE